MARNGTKIGNKSTLYFKNKEKELRSIVGFQTLLYPGKTNPLKTVSNFFADRIPHIPRLGKTDKKQTEPRNGQMKLLTHKHG